MTRREQRGLGRGGIWEELLGARDAEWLDLAAAQPDEPEDWRTLALRGGFPLPAVHLRTARERAVWFDGYVRTYLERGPTGHVVDLRAARFPKADALGVSPHGPGGQPGGAWPRRRAAATDRAPLSQPAGDIVSADTASHLRREPHEAADQSPKLYWGDTGVALHLAQEAEPGGAHLENLVLNDLLAWRDARDDRAEVLYWRTTAGEEVDFVIEAGDRLLPIEVKATERPRLRDAANLRTFRAEYGDRARAGLLLHAGSRLEWLTADVLAAPWWRVM